MVNVDPVFFYLASVFPHCKQDTLASSTRTMEANPCHESTWEPLVSFIFRQLNSWIHWYGSMVGWEILIYYLNFVISFILIFFLSFLKMSIKFWKNILGFKEGFSKEVKGVSKIS